MRLLKDHRMSIINLKIRTPDTHETARYAAEITVRGHAKSEMIPEKAEKVPGIVSVICL